MDNVFKPRGATKASQPDAGGAVLRSNPVFAIVKDNIDPVRMGRIRVYISDIGGEDPDNSDNWVTVGYMSTFFGQTQSSGGTSGYGEYAKNPNSYGVWNSPPDIGTTVICIFINGDTNYGYYIGCVPEAETLYMVPAIGASSNVVLNDSEAGSYGGAKRLPVTNLNTNNKGLIDGANFINESRPVHSYLAATLAQQGLVRDPIRGPIGTSAQRESPSRVGWGVSTPGRPIYEGGYTDENISDQLENGNPQGLKIISRRAGHTFVMDDGDLLGQDQLVRIRTSLGHQILLSDNGQCVTIIHANGQSYVELGKEGTVDVFSTNSVNVRTQGDLNLHADNNINIQAKKAINIASESFNLNVEQNTNIKTNGDFTANTEGSHGVKVGKSLALSSDDEASLTSGATAFVTGSKVNLNTGSASYVPETITAIPIVQHTDTLNDGEKGWASAPGKLPSIVSRAPAHMPWANANQGVDVEVSGSADDELPSSPSPEIAEANNSVSAVDVKQVNSVISSTVPTLPGVSESLNGNMTGTLVGQTSVLAATNPLTQEAVLAGKGIIETQQGKVASLGQLAQTPAQLEQAGFLKPGSSQLVNSLVSQGKSLENAIPTNLFTGKDGVTNLDDFVNNTAPQIKTSTIGLQQAQSTLVNSGLITGKESPTQIAGAILTTANQGIQATSNIIRNASGLVAGLSNGLQVPNNLIGDPQQLMNAGKLAANYADNNTGGLKNVADTIGGKGLPDFSGLNGALSSLSGLVSNAFNTIVSSLPKLKAGVPQNLNAISNDASNAINNEVSGVAEVQGSIGGLGGLQGGAKAVSNVVNKSIGQVGTSLAGITGAIAGAGSNPLDAIKQQVLGNANSIKNIANPAQLQDGFNSLQSELGSMLSIGPLAAKIPTVAVDTYDRSQLTSQVTSLLGNPKIPPPDYSGNSATYNESKAESLLSKQLEQSRAADNLLKQIKANRKIVDSTIVELKDAMENLPAGDPKIAQLKAQLGESLNKSLELSDQLQKLTS